MFLAGFKWFWICVSLFFCLSFLGWRSRDQADAPGDPSQSFPRGAQQAKQASPSQPVQTARLPAISHQRAHASSPCSQRLAFREAITAMHCLSLAWPARHAFQQAQPACKASWLRASASASPAWLRAGPLPGSACACLLACLPACLPACVPACNLNEVCKHLLHAVILVSL